MRRATLALAGLAALAALPVAASGDSGGAAARASDDVIVRLAVKSEDGKPTALKNFRFRRLKADCAGDVTATISGQASLIRVNSRRRFSELIDQSGHKVRIRGRVRANLKRVRGTLRARGDFSPQAQNCDSGRVHWKWRANGR